MESSWQRISGYPSSFWFVSQKGVGGGVPEAQRAFNPAWFKSLRYLATLTILFGAIVCSFADDALTLSFPDNSQRYAWVQDGYPTTLPKDPVSVVSTQIQLAIPAKTPGARVFVWDKKLGTVAERQISGLQDDSWDVKPADYTEFAEVQVSVEYGGNPVAAASVDLKDSNRTQSQVLDSSAKGLLSFFMVKTGKIEASVKYRSNGAMASPVIQSFDLAAKADPVPTFKIAVPGPVETVSVPSSSDPTVGGALAPAATAPGGAAAIPVSGGPVSAPVQSNPIGSLIVVVVVLVVVMAGGYSALMWVKKNPAKAKATFEQVGIQIPKAPDDDLNTGIPAVPLAAPAPPQPVQKIMLGDSSPDPLSGSAPAAPISLGGLGGPAVAASPQLRSASGDVIPIGDAPIIVGRDPGLGLSLIGESTVSRRHAELVKDGGSVTVKDLGSTNGTYVNGNRLQGEAALRPGDEVQFGAIRFRYEG